MSIYHPGCARQAGPLGGVFDRCCGRHGSSSHEDVCDPLATELKKLGSDLKTEFTNVTESVR